MTGHLEYKDLQAMIRAGDVDTVLTVIPDGQGRLMGKRVVGQAFLDHVADEGLHACIYLFTVDIDMEPLPGFKLTSWEKGYGDMHMVPDMGTLRLIPWLPKTALVFCDVFTEAGEPIEEAPRWVLRVYLRHVLDAIEKIEAYVVVGRDIFMATSHGQDGVIRQLEITGEASKRLSQDLRT